MKIAFLILHYKNVKDTLNCIDSIFATIHGAEIHIVIVDNGSNDGSGTELKSMYSDHSNVTVIISENNLGFSKGNNLGYTYIREHLEPDFVVVTNNDVAFYQNDLADKIQKIYRETHFFVLGPDIFIPNNHEHQSPLFLKPMTIQQLEKDKHIYEKYLSNLRGFVIRRKFQLLKNNLCTNNVLFRKIYNKLKKKSDIDYRLPYENVGLQGSCLIISKDYLRSEEKMFSPEPFLYCEEVFLYYKCKKKGYKVVYRPEISIRHEECGSIKNANGNAVKQAKFTLPHHVKAREQLIAYIRENHLEDL